MKPPLKHSFGLGLLLWGALAASVQAIPGESVNNVEAWIQAHPTLRPAPTERLVVNRAETPARRFTFRASIFPVTGVATDTDLRNVIRTEQISLVDTIDGVSAERFEESLRAIYDAVIYNDYRRAQVLYRYPSNDLLLGNENVLREGELREGDRFAYWLDRVITPEGFPISGTMTVFLKEDLPALQAELESR